MELMFAMVVVSVVVAGAASRCRMLFLGVLREEFMVGVAIFQDFRKKALIFMLILYVDFEISHAPVN